MVVSQKNRKVGINTCVFREGETKAVKHRHSAIAKIWNHNCWYGMKCSKNCEDGGTKEDFYVCLKLWI